MIPGFDSPMLDSDVRLDIGDTRVQMSSFMHDLGSDWSVTFGTFTRSRSGTRACTTEADNGKPWDHEPNPWNSV